MGDPRPPFPSDGVARKAKHVHFDVHAAGFVSEKLTGENLKPKSDQLTLNLLELPYYYEKKEKII